MAAPGTPTSCPSRAEHGGEPRLTQVAVRELRQNLSVYLRRIETGDTLEVTHHGIDRGPRASSGSSRSGERPPAEPA